MKPLVIILALLVSVAVYAQSNPPAPAPPAASQSPAAAPDSDPTADTSDPTLLKAQIMILTNAQEVYRGHLSALSDFQEYEKYRNLAEAKQQKLQTVMQGRAKAPAPK